MTVAVRVIPCLDVDAGRVVKGVNFENLRDAGDPVELAARYDAEGADELTFLDITASSGGRETMYDVVRRTAEQVFIPLTVGGGVRSIADVDALLRAGADKVSRQHRRDRPARAPRARQPGSSARSAWCCRWTPGGSRRPADPERLRGHHARRPHAAPASTRSSGRAAAPSSARARSCSTRWTPTAPRTASTWR